MKELEHEFLGKGEMKGFLFRLKEKKDTAYLFEVLKNNEVSHYEVFKRVENIRFNTVSYPSSKSFGDWAWNYRFYIQAKNKFNDL